MRNLAVIGLLVSSCGGESFTNELFVEPVEGVDGGGGDAPVVEPGEAAPVKEDAQTADSGTPDCHLKFSGAYGSFAIFGDVPNIAPPFTVEAWFLLSPGDGIDVSRVGPENPCGWRLSFDGTARGSVTGGLEVISPPRGVGEWTHVAWVHDGATTSIFVGGQRLAVKAGSGSPSRCSGPMLAGTAVDDSGNAMSYNSGSLDELRISTVARYSLDFAAQRRLSEDTATARLWHFDSLDGLVFAGSVKLECD